MTDRQARHPALPRQHRHGYAAGFHRGLPTGETTQIRSWPPPRGSGHALHPGPYPPDLSRWNSYGALTAGSSRIPSCLASRTRTVWQYRHVPSLSGLLPPPRRLPVQLPPASARPLRRPGGGVLSPPHGHKAPRGARFPCSARMSYGWIGCLLDPGGSGARATGCASPGRRLPLFNGPPLSPWITTRPRMSDSRGISEGSLSFTPASLPLACGPRRNGTLGLFPELRTRQDTILPRTSGRGRAIGHCPDYVPGISQPPSTYSLTPCDNASQGTYWAQPAAQSRRPPHTSA
jgi:hypothetical protein